MGERVLVVVVLMRISLQALQNIFRLYFWNIFVKLCLDLSKIKLLAESTNSAFIYTYLFLMSMIMLLLWLTFSCNIVFNKIVFCAIFDRNCLVSWRNLWLLIENMKTLVQKIILTMFNLTCNQNLPYIVFCVWVFIFFLCWKVRSKSGLSVQFNCAHKWIFFFLNMIFIITHV